MFIYLLALVATIFLIFGLLHGRYLSLRSSALYNGLICAPVVGASLNDDNVQDTLPVRPAISITNRSEFADYSTTKPLINYKNRPEASSEEGGSKGRSVNPARCSFENVTPKETDINSELTIMKNLQLGNAQEDTIPSSRLERQENIFETLKSSAEKALPFVSPRLNSRQIYNLLLKETLKEDEARQKLMDNINKNKVNETMPGEMKDVPPSSSENRDERQDNSNRL